MVGGFYSSTLVRGVAALSSGQMVAAIIPILAAPILGRLYLPSEYGVLAIYMSIASVLAGLGNWQYAQGIVVEGRNINAEVLQRLCMLTSAITAVIALCIALAIVFSSNLPAQWQHARGWFLALPASTFIGGIVATWRAMANRNRMYRSMATIQVITVSFTVSASIFMGMRGDGYIGLIVSYFIGQLISFFAYGYLMSKRERKVRRIGRRQLFAMGCKHKKFALFTMPSAFLDNFTMQLPIYALTFLGAVDMLGLFNRARQLLFMPMTLLGGSIAQVFQQRAAVDYTREGSCRPLFIKTFFLLAGLGIIPMTLLFILAPDIFAVFLGPNWRDAGEIARILAPMLLLQLICSPLSTIYYIVGVQREDFILTTITAIMSVLIAFSLIHFSWEPIWIIVGYSVVFSITYMIYILRGYTLSKCL